MNPPREGRASQAPEIPMPFVLIPLADALPAVRGHLARWPEEDHPPSPEEMWERVEVTCRYLLVTQVLLAFIERLTGRPSPN